MRVIHRLRTSLGPWRQDLYPSEHMTARLRRRSSDYLSASLPLTQLPRISTTFSPGVFTFFQQPLCFWLQAPRSLSLSGYTVTWLPSRGTMSLLAAGAPRYQHVGRVLLFHQPKGGGPWSQIQEIDGSQVSLAQWLQAVRGWRDTSYALCCLLNTHSFPRCVLPLCQALLH